MSALKAHFYAKYTPVDLHPPDLAVNMLRSKYRVIPQPNPFTRDEIASVLETFKNGKSTGTDGVSYELLKVAMQTDLGASFVSELNRYLEGKVPFPADWLSAHMTLLPKVRAPSVPSQLRPIVLSPASCKLFTKALLLRLRPQFPPLGGGQVLGQSGGQVMDAVCVAKHIMHLSAEWKRPLILAKLDVSQAFDTLSHPAVASLLADMPASGEAMTLLRLITSTSVNISVLGASWTQPLRRGVLQGSPYGAEIFARVLDRALSRLCARWERLESTWIKDSSGRRPLFSIAYADDILLFATSPSQLSRMLRDLTEELQTVGLSLSLTKSQYIQSQDEWPSLEDAVELPLTKVSSFVYLGVLLGFAVTCQATLAARIIQATNSIYAYVSFLTHSASTVARRLALLSAFVTSRWRWMSAAVRPVAAVSKLLRTTHTNFLLSMLRPVRDPLQGVTDSWIAARRAARMCAQACHQLPWEHIQASAFFSYWGHAARFPYAQARPLTKALEVRSVRWLLVHQGRTRRALGNWPNAARLLTLAWQDHRQPWEPLFWDQVARDRARWGTFTRDWLNSKGLGGTFYPCLEDVDLRGRKLLHSGDLFSLLPLRHPPVEEPYDAAYEHVPRFQDDTEQAQLRVATDGSSFRGIGGVGVCILPPYGDILQDAVIIQAAVPGRATNIRAEILAATQGLKAVRTLLQLFPQSSFLLQTDSMHVVQTLQSSISTVKHAQDVSQLLLLWQEVRHACLVMHVKAHHGHPLNEVADIAAKQAVLFQHMQVLTRRPDYSCAVFSAPGAELPPLHVW